MKKILLLLLLAILSLQMIEAAWAASTWQLERPAGAITVKERTENKGSDDAAAVGLGVSIGNYVEDYQPYGGRDYVAMNVSMTGNSRRAISYTAANLSRTWIGDVDFDAGSKLMLFDGSTQTYDDAGKWVQFPSWFTFRFYGGHDSAEYKSVWVCTNGFLSFNLANSTSSIPSYMMPNLVAPLWTDLRVDNQSYVVAGTYSRGMPGRSDVIDYYVVIWNNVLPWIPGIGQTGPRLTFEVLLQIAQPWASEPGGLGDDNRQSDIYFTYYSVGALNPIVQFAYGIGNQEGSVGYGGLHAGADLASLNQKTVWIYQNSHNFFIQSLVVSGSDTNTGDTNFRIDQSLGMIRGYHVSTSSAESHSRR